MPEPRPGRYRGDRSSRLHALLDGAPALEPESVPPVVAIGATTASACHALTCATCRPIPPRGICARRRIPHLGASSCRFPTAKTIFLSVFRRDHELTRRPRRLRTTA